MIRTLRMFASFHSVNYLYNWMIMIKVCLLWKVIQRCKMNSKIILFLLTYTDRCCRLVTKGASTGKCSELPRERDSAALFYKKVSLDFYELFILYSFVYFWFTR